MANTPLLSGVKSMAPSTLQKRKCIYPYGLNKVLGDALFNAAMQWAAMEVEEELPPVFMPYMEQRCHDGDVFQPDYHGGTG